jgi:DMSO/TMAO reductase YedYZ molybdopterin-dependent catalytic subunit
MRHTPALTYLRCWTLRLLLGAAPLLMFAGGRGEYDAGAKTLDQASDRYPEYLSLAQGLHVTGTPIEVDVESYRLKVNGLVTKPLELRLSEVRALPQERLFLSLNCPGFFTDEGNWTGVRLDTILRLAGCRAGATVVELTSVDGSYAQSLTLAEVLDGNVLVAYQFDDRDFPVYHGFPLRIAAEGQTGSKWVKWLGSITVR